MSFPVRNTPELRRVAELPRRVWNPADAAQLAVEWSPHLLTPQGKEMRDWAYKMSETRRAAALEKLGREKRPVEMNPSQVMCLYDFLAARGLFAVLPVGKGKTMLSLLLTTLAYQHFGISQSSLLVMASGERQTYDDLGALTEVWQAPALPQILTYNWLGTPGNGFKLCGCLECQRELEETTNSPDAEEKPDGSGLQPKLFLADECDCLASESSSCSLRTARYLSTHADDVMSGFMTGTPMRKSIRDFRRMLLWALKLKAPAPFDWVTTQEVCEAIDTDPPRSGRRRPPGALRQFADPERFSEDPLAACQEGWGRRIAETEGVIIIDEPSCNTPITVKLIQAPDDDVLEKEYFRFGSTGKTPPEPGNDGWLIPDPLGVRRYRTQLSAGSYTMWDPRPPEPWCQARRMANKFIKEAIVQSQRHGRPMDSEKEVFRRFPQAPPLVAWKEIKDTFKPNVVNVRVTLSVLEFAAKKMRELGPCLVWVQHEWDGDTLSQLTGVPYYQGKGKSKCGRYIGDADGSESAILSVHANRRQRNLQMFNKNLLIAPEQSAKWLEQQFGRTHRNGQTEEVLICIILSSGDSCKAIEKALSEAQGSKRVTIGQKILTATWDWSECGQCVTDPNSLPADDIRRARWCYENSNNEEKDEDNGDQSTRRENRLSIKRNNERDEVPGGANEDARPRTLRIKRQTAG